MKALSAREAEAWCERRAIPLDTRRLPLRPTEESFKIPEDAGARVALVSRQLEAYRGDPEALVWFTEWSVWPSGERPHIFARLLASYGEERPLVEVPAVLFGPEEFEDLASFVAVGVLFLWDIFVLGWGGSKRMHYSHDESGWLVV